MRYRSRFDEDEKQDKYLMLRQILNIIFMLGAVAGVLLSMFFKMVECVFRLLK